MKPIDGINLAEIARETGADILAEQRRSVARMVRGIQTNIITWTEQKHKAEKDLEKLSGQIEGAKDKLRRITEGDWSVLNENMLKGQPSPEKG